MLMFVLNSFPLCFRRNLTQTLLLIVIRGVIGLPKLCNPQNIMSHMMLIGVSLKSIISGQFRKHWTRQN